MSLEGPDNNIVFAASKVVNLSQNLIAGTFPIVRKYRAYYLDTSSGTITMVANGSPIHDDEYLFKDTGGAADVHNVLFDTNGSTLDGASGIVTIISTARGWSRIKYNGTSWSLV